MFFHAQARNCCLFDDSWLSSNSTKYPLHVCRKEVLYFQMLCFIIQQQYIHYSWHLKRQNVIYWYTKSLNQLDLYKKRNLLQVVTYQDGWIHLLLLPQLKSLLIGNINNVYVQVFCSNSFNIFWSVSKINLLWHLEVGEHVCQSVSHSSGFTVDTRQLLGPSPPMPTLSG